MLQIACKWEAVTGKGGVPYHWGRGGLPTREPGTYTIRPPNYQKVSLQFSPKYGAESAAASQGRINRFQEDPEVEVAIVAHGSRAIFVHCSFFFKDDIATISNPKKIDKQSPPKIRVALTNGKY
jgi:hypothetical protein